MEFHHKLLSSLYLAILSSYLTWCISIILFSSDIEINLGPKSSSRKCLSICHWNLNDIVFNWDLCKGEQRLQGMKIKEKESQKAKVFARNVRFAPLDRNWEFLSFGAGGFGDLL